MTPEQMKALRDQTGLNQTEFAALLGMTQQSYSRLETSERKPTHLHKSNLNKLMFIVKHRLLNEYIKCSKI